MKIRLTRLNDAGNFERGMLVSDGRSTGYVLSTNLAENSITLGNPRWPLRLWWWVQHQWWLARGRWSAFWHRP